MNWQQEKDNLGRDLVKLAYDVGCIETIFNTNDPEKRKNGWILKNGTNSIWYINMRNAGNSGKFTAELGYAMGRTLEEEIKDYNIIIGVDMAGIPLVSAISTSMYELYEIDVKWGYTRPLPGEKIRTVEDARTALNELKQKKLSLGQWGSHNLVEGMLHSGYNVVITDDMVTSFGSKLIAREVIKWEAERRDVDIKCNTVLVAMDREQGAVESAKKECMNLHSVIPMKSKGIGWLKDAMPQEQYEHVFSFINDPSQYQDIDRDPAKDKTKGKSSILMKDALELARAV